MNAENSRDWNEGNRKVIEDFRSHGGKTGDNRELVLLTTTGARSGRPHTTSLMFLQDGDRWVVIASKGAAPSRPDRYHNLVANPVVTAEVGTETFEAEATVPRGSERDDLHARQAGRHLFFGTYQDETTRTIPAVILTRRC